MYGRVYVYIGGMVAGTYSYAIHAGQLIKPHKYLNLQPDAKLRTNLRTILHVNLRTILQTMLHVKLQTMLQTI